MADEIVNTQSINSLPVEILRIVLSRFQYTEEAYFIGRVNKLWNSLISQRRYHPRKIVEYYAKHGTFAALRLIRKILNDDSNLFLTRALFQHISDDVFRWVLPSLRRCTTVVLLAATFGSAYRNDLARIKTICELSLLRESMVIKTALFTAAEYGHLEIIQHYRYFYSILPVAASRGHLHVIKWCRENGWSWPWKCNICTDAAKGGHLDLVQWCHENGRNLDNTTIEAAAKSGSLDIIQYCISKGVSWSHSTTTYAAQGGHLEIIKWARASGCCWGLNTLAKAVSGGHKEVFEWCKANGCTD